MSRSERGAGPAGMIASVISWVLRRTLIVYHEFLSPLLPRACRFAPTCSEYARLALERHGLWRGLLMVASRLSRCHPLHAGGWDPPS